MRQVLGRVALLVVGLVAGPMGIRAQIKRPVVAPEKSACSYVSKAEAEAVVGAKLEPAVEDAKKRSCRYLEAGFAADAKKRQVSIAIARSYFQNASDVNIRRDTLADDHSVEPMVTRELSNFGDESLWVWAGGYLGVLYAFKGGTTEVAIKISGLREQEAQAAAKKFAARVLGGSGSSGYKYASPEMTMTAKNYFMAEILRPLYEGEFERVRDDEQARRYVMALMQGLNGACPKMPDAMPVMEYGFHFVWRTDHGALKAEAGKDFGEAFAGQMQRFSKSSPEILREGNADAVAFVKENAAKNDCMTAPVQRLYKNITELAAERQKVLPTDWR